MDRISPAEDLRFTVVGSGLPVAIFGGAAAEFKCFSIAHGRPNLPLNLKTRKSNQNAQECLATTIIIDLSLPESAGASGVTKALSHDFERLDRYNAIETATYVDPLTRDNEDAFYGKT